MARLSEYIVSDKEIASGAPVFKGTRVTVKTLFDHLEESSLEVFLNGFPSVSRMQAEGVIEYMADKVLSEIAA